MCCRFVLNYLWFVIYVKLVKSSHVRQFDKDLRFIIESILGEVFLAISNALNEYAGVDFSKIL